MAVPGVAFLSWAEDTTQYPNLFEGDEVIYEGYVWEWKQSANWGFNETEIWVTSPNIAVVNLGQPIPLDTINTGDLRLPATAEQWENCKIVVTDAIVTDLDPTGDDLFAVDDGSGQAIIGAVSTAIPDPAQFVDPPLGAVYDSIYGYASHRYGSYSDSSTYKLEPMYYEDMVLGSGPPMMTIPTRNPGVPLSTDNVDISMDITTNLSVQSAMIYYSIDGSAYQTATMSAAGGDTYSGSIPAQASGSFVEYFVKATDTANQSSQMPSDTSAYKYGYIINDAGLQISDVQWSPWYIANSPFDGYNIEVTGIVTADTAANNNYGAYSIQDAQSQWSGLFAFGIDEDLVRGDEITIQGIVSEQNPDWTYKWGNNTVVLVESYSVGTTGNTINSMEVATGDLANTNPGAESYEGTVVHIVDVTLVSVNTYDATFTDGSGECLVDDDLIHKTSFEINSDSGCVYAFGDTIWPGEVVDAIRGVFTYSFGTYKIEVRDANDFGPVVGINHDYEPVPLAYKLNQNFPNPFNPETRIYFEIPENNNVTIIVYNMLGQMVRTVTKEEFKAGRHVVNWDGRDDTGNLVSTGVYIYRIKAGNFIACKKMMLMK